MLAPVCPALIMCTVYDVTMRYPIIHFKLLDQGQIDVFCSFHQTQILKKMSELTEINNDMLNFKIISGDWMFKIYPGRNITTCK
jgi:hypothetical protein